MENLQNPYVKWIDDNQQTHHLEIINKIFIGRSCEGIDENKRILVKHSLTSRDHAVITRKGSLIQITDSSKNGTWVNGVRLAAGSSQYLANGDEIQVGAALIRLSCSDTLTTVREETDSTIIDSRKIIVTNLVADVRGYSSMSQTEDSSHQVYTIMNEIINTFSEIVHEYRGTIKDYAGDAVYAFWDHCLEPRREQAKLACQAALKQAQSIDQIRSKLLKENPAVENLRLGWGITTGSVTMSHYGTRAVDLALVGDCTNLAFRFSGIANKDLSSKIVICSKTADLISDTELSVADLGFVSVRGRSGSEHVFGIKHEGSEK
jgi:adenylate cyclase